MKRNIATLCETPFDVLVIGGGIHGAWTALDASQRGLHVALIDQADFASGTSSNSMKIIHGGTRYLQHCDIKRVRESIAECITALKIAPHLIHPLPCCVPLYKKALKNRYLMQIALLLNDFIGKDERAQISPHPVLGKSKVISRDECKEILPAYNHPLLSGAALWFEGQVYNSERLIISLLHSAVTNGAVIANYVKADALLKDKKPSHRACGIQARDMRSGRRFEIRSRTIINATGPWIPSLAQSLGAPLTKNGFSLVAGMNLILRKCFSGGFSVGLPTQNRRHVGYMFIRPWREYSLAGVYYKECTKNPGTTQFTKEDVKKFISIINETYPAASLRMDDVHFVLQGLLAAKARRNRPFGATVMRHPAIIDHKSESGVDCLFSMSGVKYTTARSLAANVVDVIFNKLLLPFKQSQTHRIPVYGGNIRNWQDFYKNASGQLPQFSEGIRSQLIKNYGTEYRHILSLGTGEAGLLQSLSDTAHILRAEVIHAIRGEMAQTLADIVFRRTELASAGMPDKEALRCCAHIAAAELGWNDEILEEQLTHVQRILIENLKRCSLLL